MKKLYILLYCISITLVYSINYSYAGSVIDQNIIDEGGTPTTSSNTAPTSAVNSSNVGTTGQNGSTAVDTSAQNQANGTTGISSSNNILGIDDNDLRRGNVDMDTIPRVLVSVINVLLGVAGTISIVALIYYAIQMQINSGITGDSSGVDNAKKGMKGAILGFIVAILAWFIVIRFIEILSRVS